jgi:serine/threonine protein phosphatase PrpC
MQCPHCSADIPDQDIFCEACGQRLVDAPPPAACVHQADEEGFCELCGLRVAPAPGDHEEIVLAHNFAGVTDRGVRRTRNEDRFAIRAAAGAQILVVCDGVSTSHESQLASAAASQAAADSLAQALENPEPAEPETRMQAAIAAAGRSVATVEPGHADENPSSTTIVAALVHNGSVTIGWAGDSRAYWISANGTARQLTIDHSWLAQVVAAGEMTREQAERSPTAHAITRWLGADSSENDACSVVRFPLVTPGVLLLCSDGLWNYAPEAEQIAALVMQLQNGTGDMLKLTRGLIDFAKKKGGGDNITAAALRIEMEPEHGE